MRVEQPWMVPMDGVVESWWMATMYQQGCDISTEVEESEEALTAKRASGPLVHVLALGISLSNGERWKVIRTFAVKTLKSFGFGKKSIESKIQTEAQCIVEEFRNSNGESRAIFAAVSHSSPAAVEPAQRRRRSQRLAQPHSVQRVTAAFLASAIEVSAGQRRADSSGTKSCFSHSEHALSQPLDPEKKIMDAFSNVLCSVIFGDRFEYKDERFIKFLKIAEDTFQLTSSTWGQLKSMLPTIMKYVPGPHHRMITISVELEDFIHERVKSSIETLDPSTPRHYIDSFLIKMEEEKNNPNTEFNLKNLLMSTHNLFVAGIETVSTTLRYGLLILLRYPEIQAKIHKEIDQVIGQNRPPNFEDRMEMHYTQAVIQEIHRFSDVIPLNLPHLVTRDVKFRGYQIPKGTEIYPLLCTVHRDPKQFSSPWKFDPNRFLDESGKFKKNEAVMPFSVGKRICPGEVLARMEIFIFLTTILQNFELTSKTQFTDSDIAPKLAGFLNTPIHYEVSFVPRDI
ncbi:unnamed protein product [Ranitomeya imitator]|uniref:Cytochrome P450 n=1 Tax=Ranitomeya imitator TaxID=111125 RepID=A0ABN9MR49_9NEOB|nr:unnamed protein product [Ranitomeya imitator]